MEAEASVPPTRAPSYNWERIPLWKAAGKRFELVADELNGRIPVTRLESWKDFAGLLNDPFFTRQGVELVYRGHRRYDWSLTPSLGRLTETGIISKETAETQLERFRRAVRGRLEDHSLVEDEQADELWSVGQHHGLMTPLLDWTYSPYVALFFAFGSDDQGGKGKEPEPLPGGVCAEQILREQ
ncbi:MAG: FRG domain-containing protein [Prosthecobacter sp.]